MKLLSLKEHFSELKSRLTQLLIIYIFIFIICYYFKDNIYNIILEPLAKISFKDTHKIIYTGLAEGFFAYLKLSAFSGFILTLPFISLQIYLFIKDALSLYERKIAAVLLIMAPILFWLGSIFMFYYVMPKAWVFFLSFESKNTILPIILEAKISEYLDIVIQLVVGFGIAFQLPVVLILLNILKIIDYKSLIKKRRAAIVINFIIGAILTPPDIISQFALAIPMILLYELSIIICKFIDNRGKNA